MILLSLKGVGIVVVYPRRCLGLLVLVFQADTEEYSTTNRSPIHCHRRGCCLRSIFLGSDCCKFLDVKDNCVSQCPQYPCWKWEQEGKNQYYFWLYHVKVLMSDFKKTYNRVGAVSNNSLYQNAKVHFFFRITINSTFFLNWTKVRVRFFPEHYSSGWWSRSLHHSYLFSIFFLFTFYIVSKTETM